MSRPSRINRQSVATAALLYYKDGLTQSEISQRLNVSRATVVGYLKMAREQGLVDIRVDGTSFSASRLSRDLKAKYGLKDVYIASISCLNNAVESGMRERLIHLAQVAAMAVSGLVMPNDRIGVAWGQTMGLMAKELPLRPVANVSVYQAVGAASSPLMDAAESCTIRIAASLGAQCNTLHAPAVVSTKELAEQLREEKVIADQLAKLNELNKFIFSIGAINNATHLVQVSIANLDELNWYADRGAACSMTGRVIDHDGHPIHGPLDDRLIGITLDQVKKIPDRIMVAYGPGKYAALKACLAGKWATHVVIDDVTAEKLLREV